MSNPFDAKARAKKLRDMETKAVGGGKKKPKKKAKPKKSVRQSIEDNWWG